MFDQIMAAIALGEPPHSVVGWRNLRDLRSSPGSHVSQMHVLNGWRIGQLLALELAAIQVDDDPSAHFIDARVNRASRPKVGDDSERHLLNLAFLLAIRLSKV